MKKSALVASLVLALAGCQPNADEIGKQVKVLLQQKIDQQPELKKYHLAVSKVDVIREEGNKYQGIADVVMNGEDHSVVVQILADGDRIMYEADPKAFLFVAQQSLKETIDGTSQTLGYKSRAPGRNTNAAQEKPGGVVGAFDSSPH